jgi:lipoprotein-anchoring transpeptidase ErfK/SrfK
MMLMGSLAVTIAAAGAAAGMMPYRGGEDLAEGSTKRGTIEVDADGDDPGVAPTPSVATEQSDPTGDGEDADAERADVGAGPERRDTGAGSEQLDPTVGAEHNTEAARLEHGDPSEAPRRSGHGRRVVYDMSDQRVWLVGADGSVRRSYLVSGSVYDNLEPGSYRVYSRSRHAVSFDQQSTMDFMVRFTEGDNAAIGFHDIPENVSGDPVQSFDQLGTPLSHGCIRQRPADAMAMWRFADLGTLVRVLA